jgi:hypothetical protein
MLIEAAKKKFEGNTTSLFKDIDWAIKRGAIHTPVSLLLAAHPIEWVARPSQGHRRAKTLGRAPYLMSLLGTEKIHLSSKDMFLD